MAATKSAARHAERSPQESAAKERTDRTVRERLLDAADRLFYAEGIHTVGIDRVIQEAGVAKASLYGTFGSKDELVLAYLAGRSDARQARIEQRLAKLEGAREKILGIFELLVERVSEPSFRGCAFVNSTAEGPRSDSKVRQVALKARMWMRTLFTTLAEELEIEDAGRLGVRLQILYDGAMTAASMEADPKIVEEARAMAEQLLDGALRPRSANIKAPPGARRKRA